MNMFTPVAASEVLDQADTEDEAHTGYKRAAWIVAAMVLAAVAVYLWRGHAPTMAAPPPPVLTVATPLQREVMEWDDYVGRFEASKSVEVRPRLAGQLVGIHFKDGDIVRKGQLLFTLDARPFSAALAEARADAASARAELGLARANLGRANRLIADEAVSKSDLDQLRAKERAASASLASAQARIRARSLDVEFTQVRAPISGRISDRRIDVGSMVSTGADGAGTLLTTINALDPIYFSFSGSEGLFLKAKRAQQEGAVASPVQIKLQDEADYKWQGQLDFTDNGIDPQSGTIRGRALLANPELFLTPGMFGEMRLSTGGTSNVLLVPDAAIQTDQARKTVFVVDSGGKVAVKAVQIGPVIDGLRVIRSGLAATDQVVITGTQFAQPGTQVKTKRDHIAPKQVEKTVPQLPQSSQATFVN